MLAVGPTGLASADPKGLTEAVLQCLDDFLDIISAPGTDLTRPSRLKGWSGADTCIHMGQWADRDTMTAVVASARAGGVGEDRDAASVDAANERLVAAHRAEGVDAIVNACVRGRDSIEEFLESPLLDELGQQLTHSSLGPMPVLTLLHAGVYELAVHALDLAPCGAPPPSDLLLDRGLAALLDVTGALSVRQGVHATVTAQTPGGGWAFTASADGWTTQRAGTTRFEGAGVRGSAVDLLDASAGRVNLGQLLLSRRLVVQDLPAFMRLAPLLDDVPGLPGGRALKSAVGGLGRVTRLLRIGR